MVVELEGQHIETECNADIREVIEHELGIILLGLQMLWVREQDASV